MGEDLVNYFGYNASIEKRKVKCYVLHSIDSPNIVVDTDRKQYNNFGRRESITYMHNQPISMLTGYLDELLSVPVLDESNYNKPVDMEFTIDMKDIKALQQVLKTYGFALVETERELEMFVLSDK